MSNSQPTKYRFVTKWQIKSSLEKVWEAIDKSEDWPSWWKGMERTELLEEGNKDGTGKIIRFTWKSFLPFLLSFDLKITGKEIYKKISGEAIGGDLLGTGVWTFDERDGTTYIEYDWNVVSTKKIINFMSPILGWFFRYNHNLIMHWGAKGLSKKLHAELREG